MASITKNFWSKLWVQPKVNNKIISAYLANYPGPSASTTRT
jgi:hypothetical protein